MDSGDLAYTLRPSSISIPENIGRKIVPIRPTVACCIPEMAGLGFEGRIEGG